MGFFSKLFGKKEAPAEAPARQTRENSSAPARRESLEEIFGVAVLQAPKGAGTTEHALDMRRHEIGDLFEVWLPGDWEPFESDRFRAKTPDESTLLSITLYGGEEDADAVAVTADFYRDRYLDMFKRYVSEGEYEPYDDLLISDAFITQSFKVDDETQYYLTTCRELGGKLVTANIIIRNLGEYSTRLRAVIQAIHAGLKAL